jgi:hypothetical protein
MKRKVRKKKERTTNETPDLMTTSLHSTSDREPGF